MIENIRLSPRLRSAAELVSKGAFIADVGTDHAYLPIALCLEEKIRGGVASDINDGPIDRAKENISKYGLSDRLCAVKTDGLAGIETYRPDHVMILGMGGELIARILIDAPWTKNGGIRLCLQPMTHPEKLRAFLAENGYEITDERIVVEEKENKIYQIIAASYCGKKQFLTDEELLLGKINIRRGGEALLRLASQYEKALKRRVDGKREAGADVSDELSLIESINTAVKGR